MLSNSSDDSSKSDELTSTTEIDLTPESENSSSKQTEIVSSSPRAATKFRPGQSGNPNGRPKGAKNAITLLKQSLELQLREQAKPQIGKVLKKAIDLALAGDRMMIKLLLELHMSKTAHQEDEKGGKSQVAVVIQNLTDRPVSQPILIRDHIDG